MKEICPYDECKRVLSTPYSLKRHIDTCHNNVRKFICSHCDKKFSSQRNLWTHLAKHRVTQISTLARKLGTDTSQTSSVTMAVDTQETNFLEEAVRFPEVTETRRYEGKLPLAWLLLSKTSRSRGSSVVKGLRG